MVILLELGIVKGRRSVKARNSKLKGYAKDRGKDAPDSMQARLWTEPTLGHFDTNLYVNPQRVLSWGWRLANTMCCQCLEVKGFQREEAPPGGTDNVVLVMKCWKCTKMPAFTWPLGVQACFRPGRWSEVGMSLSSRTIPCWTSIRYPKPGLRSAGARSRRKSVLFMEFRIALCICFHISWNTEILVAMHRSSTGVEIVEEFLTSRAVGDVCQVDLWFLLLFRTRLWNKLSRSFAR